MTDLSHDASARENRWCVLGHPSWAAAGCTNTRATWIVCSSSRGHTSHFTTHGAWGWRWGSHAVACVLLLCLHFLHVPGRIYVQAVWSQSACVRDRHAKAPHVGCSVHLAAPAKMQWRGCLLLGRLRTPGASERVPRGREGRHVERGIALDSIDRRR